MKKEEYCDIEYSRKLAEYFQDAEWFWAFMTHQKIWKPVHKRNLYKNEETYPAITTDMLFAILPHLTEIRKDKILGFVAFYKNNKKVDKKLSNALAKLMLWLIHEGLLK